MKYILEGKSGRVTTITEPLALRNKVKLEYKKVLHLDKPNCEKKIEEIIRKWSSDYRFKKFGECGEERVKLV